MDKFYVRATLLKKNDEDGPIRPMAHIESPSITEVDARAILAGFLLMSEGAHRG